MMSFDPATAMVAIAGLVLQGVVGWVYVQILKEEVASLRKKSDAHADELAEHRTSIRALEREVDQLLKEGR